jgi:hypothetical protein
VKLVLIDVDTAGKTSNSVTKKGIKFSLGKIGLDKVCGITCDLGAGTPESFVCRKHYGPKWDSRIVWSA